MKQRILIIGLGLLGGSLGLALQALPDTTVHGRDANPAAQAQALALGLVQGLPEEGGAYDVIVLAVPPGAVAAATADLGPWFGPETLLMDVCSVKGAVIKAVQKVLGDCPRFLPAHPMAGSHLDGPGAARADLFQGRTVLLTPLPFTDPGALEAGRAFWAALGAATVDLDPGQHDYNLSVLSHLPHFLAFALAETVRQEQVDPSLAGPAFQDATRLALCPPALWADIFQANRRSLLITIQEFRKCLDVMTEALGAGSLEELTGRLEEAGNWKRANIRTQR